MKGSLVAVVALVIVLLVGLLGFGSYVSTKNHLVELNQDVEQATSVVGVAQQRRLELIPNMVASVKGYVKEEETVLTNIANARAAVIAAQGNQASTVTANRGLDLALSPLNRLQETYPNLKGNEQFMRLEDELSGTENRIAVARNRYNLALRSYNVYVEQFPNSIWAGMAGYHSKEDQYYKGNPANATAPTVDFSK